MLRAAPLARKGRDTKCARAITQFPSMDHTVLLHPADKVITKKNEHPSRLGFTF